MTDPLDQRRTLADIALLFELSLAAGTSIDLQTNCRRFVTSLMARKNLDLAQIWLRADATEDRGAAGPATDALPYHLAFAAPTAHVGVTTLGADHPLLARVREERAFRVAPDAAEVAALLGGGGLTRGTCAVFPLPPRGFLVLHASHEDVLAEAREVRQLEAVTAKLAISIEGCLAHAQAMREIAERRKAETERALAQEQLHHAQKMDAVGRLAGGVAHDFNNLLTSILGCAEILERDAEGDDQRALLELVVGAARNAADLTGQLLAFSRAAPLDVHPVPLDALVAQVGALLERTVDPQISVELDLRLGADVAVLGDESRLQSAFLNLGLNARDAIRGAGQITIRSDRVDLDEEACRRHGGEVSPGAFARVRVTDTGVGMDPQTRSRIFEPFFSTKQTGRGTGLGLAAVYGSVSSHGGVITVQSRPGDGASFEVLLPITDSPRAIEGDDVALTGQGAILVIEDDEQVRMVVERMCARLGYQVAVTASGEEGLAALDAARPDVVLLDVRMPGMGGHETLARIRERDAELPVIVVSGFVEEPELDAMRRLGTAGFLQKPVALAELSRALRAALGDSSPR
ncbi:MAG: response regulator [Sandaracinaceae bacterium]|nr:response regulator [Sandaracinaceae bacterium]